MATFNIQFTAASNIGELKQLFCELTEASQTCTNIIQKIQDYQIQLEIDPVPVPLPAPEIDHKWIITPNEIRS